MADSSEYDLAPLPTDPPKPRPVLPPSAPTKPLVSPFFEEEDEVLEEDPARPQPPPISAPKPLPRILKTAPLTIEEAEAEAKAKAAADSVNAREPGREQTVLGRLSSARQGNRSERSQPSREDVGADRKIEATPELDTYETRQRIRTLVGLLATGAVVLAIFMIVRSFGGGGSGSSAEIIVIDEADMFGPPILKKSEPGEIKGQEPGVGVAQAPVNTDPVPDPTPAPKPNFVASAPEPSPMPEPSPSPMPEPSSSPEPKPEPEALAVDRTFRPTGPMDLSPQLPEGFRAAEGAELHESGWPGAIVCERDDSTMVLIPGGTYLVGRNDGSSPAEGPAHRVRMPPYYIDVHEVTVGQYERYRQEMNLQGETVFPRPEDLKKAAPTEDHPVVMVTASQASQYADWLGKALPSEAQWEVAARGSDGRIYPWGAGPPAWSEDRVPRQVDPVKSYPEDVSPFGVQDLAGNVWEWTADWYDSRHYEGRRGQVVENPGGPSQSRSSPPQITIKGSSKTWESSYREGMRPDARLPYLGFRCVLSLEGEPRIIDAPPPPTSEPTKKRQGGRRSGPPVLVPF